jgi:hypothetical protein
MKYIKPLTTLFLLINMATSYSESQIRSESDHVLTIFVRDKLTKKTDSSLTLPAAYGGYLTFTNNNGQIILPRKTEAKQIHLLITPTIVPIFSVVNNISHWQIPTKNKAAMYTITKQTNPKNNKSEWLTKKDTISTDHHVPLHTIIVFAHPDNAHMLTGESPTMPGDQFVLPSIFATKPLKIVKSSIILPNIKPFLGKMKTAYELMPYGYATIPGR